MPGVLPHILVPQFNHILSKLEDAQSLKQKQTIPIKYLVLEGGGVKGISYVGGLEVLEEQGILASIEALAGSSAGVRTALRLYRDIVVNASIFQKQFEAWQNQQMTIEHCQRSLQGYLEK